MVRIVEAVCRVPRKFVVGGREVTVMDLERVPPLVREGVSREGAYGLIVQIQDNQAYERAVLLRIDVFLRGFGL